MIGFFGGSFDPVHYGHLRHAHLIKQELSLDKLFLMPCKAPVHKNHLHFSSKQRLDMLGLALEEFDDLAIDSREIDRQTPSYSIDTLKQIKQQHPNEKIFFIMGGDSFASINTWKNYQQLSQYAQLVVVPRAGDELQTNDSVYFAKTPLVNISSTQIRSIFLSATVKGKISNLEKLSGLVPDSIIHYITQL